MAAPLGKKERIEAAKRRERRFSLMVFAGVLVLLLAVGGIFLGPSIRKSFEPEAQANLTREQAVGLCAEGHGRIIMHIHAEVRIIIEGREIVIPEGVGLLPNCMKPIHTHDDTGTLHVESPYRYPYSLGDFFTIWGKPFSSQQILDCKADPTHRIVMTVNGVPSNEYEKHVITEGDKIVIRCVVTK